MVSALNISEEAYGMMLKTKQVQTAASKRSGATCQKLLPFLMRQRNDRVKELETEFSKSLPPDPPKARPFLRGGFRNEHTSSASTNVSPA